MNQIAFALLSLRSLRLRCTEVLLRSDTASVLAAGMLVLVVFHVSGCQQSQSDTVLKAKLNARDAAVKSKLEAHDSELSDMRRRLTKLELEKGRYSSVVLDPSSKGYERLDTDSGTFLVSLKDVKPYANGYSLVLAIGNISSARYNGFTVHVKWGTDISKASDFNAWENSLHSNDSKFTQSLYPGSWNTVTLALSPAKPDELGYIEVTMETDVIFLFVR